MRKEEISVNWDEIFKAAAKTRTLMEINSYPHRLDLSDTRVRAASAVGVKVCHKYQCTSPKAFSFNAFRRGY